MYEGECAKRDTCSRKLLRKSRLANSSFWIYNGKLSHIVDQSTIDCNAHVARHNITELNLISLAVIQHEKRSGSVRFFKLSSRGFSSREADLIHLYTDSTKVHRLDRPNEAPSFVLPTQHLAPHEEPEIKASTNLTLASRYTLSNILQTIFAPLCPHGTRCKQAYQCFESCRSSLQQSWICAK